VSHLSEAPASSTLYGSATYAADLASYRDQVIAAIRPACANERDDDGDGRVDHPDDPGCDSARDAHEDGGTARARRTWLAMLAFGALLGWRLRALWRARHSGVT